MRLVDVQLDAVARELKKGWVTQQYRSAVDKVDMYTDE